MPLAVSVAAGPLTSAHTTVAPAAANTSAVVRPMLPPAPVTSATRPVRSNAALTLSAVSTGRTLRARHPCDQAVVVLGSIRKTG